MKKELWIAAGVLGLAAAVATFYIARKNRKPALVTQPSKPHHGAQHLTRVFANAKKHHAN